MSVTAIPWPYALVGPQSNSHRIVPPPVPTTRSQSRPTHNDRDGIVHPGFLWSTPGVPHKGWTCVEVVDLGADGPEYDPETCQMCGYSSLRFVHHMEHPDYHDTVKAGCVCAENMATGYQGRDRERELKNRADRRTRWLNRRWRVSAKGNHFLNIKGTNLGVFPSPQICGEWGWWANGVFSRETYESATRAKLALFDELTRRNWI